MVARIVAVTCHNRCAVESPALAIVAANDPGSTRLVYAMVVGLAVLGVAFIGVGVWLIRRTRVDPPVLGPLERMGERRWKRRDLATQRRMLDEVRPPGASPLQPHRTPPKLLEEFDVPPPPASWTDLGPGLAAPLAADRVDVAPTAPAVDPVPTPEEPAPEEPAATEHDAAADELAVDGAVPDEPAPDEPAGDDADAAEEPVEDPVEDAADGGDPPADEPADPAELRRALD